MFSKHFILSLFLMTTWVSCRSSNSLETPFHQHGKEPEEPPQASASDDQPQFNPKKFEKMLEKAILKIITGELSTSDMLLLKSLNYSLEEVLAIRHRELNKFDNKISNSKHDEQMKKSSQDVDYDAYNKKAIQDYEDVANKMDEDYASPLDYDSIDDKKVKTNADDEIRMNFDRAMEPHVVFKIRYDDSDEFEPGSEGRSKGSGLKLTKSAGISSAQPASSSAQGAGIFQTSSRPFYQPAPVAHRLTELARSAESEADETPESSSMTSINDTDRGDESAKRSSQYEGLEWVEDDVYRVIPGALNYDSNNYEELNETMDTEYSSGNNSTEEMTNDYAGDQEDGAEDLEGDRRDQVGNLTAYQQLALAHRKDQGRKAIEDIKLKVLTLTGRFNLSTNTNQVQRERLTMFSPACQIPRNTDTEPWFNPFSMNMHFPLNLTSGDHIVAAKLRIYKLPQTNLTVENSSAIVMEDDEEEEKKIRISIYFYTKSLKKHRSKKRLMDSVVTSLTSEGGHLALDVRQALRFWRQSQTSRSIHPNSANNHGLVIQVEDQDGRPLKPEFYIQQDACRTNDGDTDEKAYQRFPALFLQACTRYVRVVNGETVTYVNCKHLKNLHH